MLSNLEVRSVFGYFVVINEDFVLISVFYIDE